MRAQSEPLGSTRWPLGVLAALAVLTLLAAIVGSAWAFLSPQIAALPSALRTPVRLLILVAQYAVPLAFAAVWLRLRGSDWRDGLLMRRFTISEGIGLAIFAGLTARIFNTVYSACMVLLQIKLPASIDTTKLFGTDASGMIALIVLAVVVAPVAEEVLFRGVLYTGLRDRWGRGAATVVSAVIFALFHGEPFVFVPIAFLGVLLALLAEKTRSVWPGVIAHSLFNATAVVVLLVVQLTGGKGVGL